MDRTIFLTRIGRSHCAENDCHILYQENCSHSLFETTIEIVAIVANLYIVYGHGVCVTDHCNCNASLCADAVSEHFLFTN